MCMHDIHVDMIAETLLLIVAKEKSNVFHESESGSASLHPHRHVAVNFVPLKS